MRRPFQPRPGQTSMGHLGWGQGTINKGQELRGTAGEGWQVRFWHSKALGRGKQTWPPNTSLLSWRSRPPGANQGSGLWEGAGKPGLVFVLGSSSGKSSPRTKHALAPATERTLGDHISSGKTPECVFYLGPWAQTGVARLLVGL